MSPSCYSRLLLLGLFLAGSFTASGKSPTKPERNRLVVVRANIRGIPVEGAAISVRYADGAKDLLFDMRTSETGQLAFSIPSGRKVSVRADVFGSVFRHTTIDTGSGHDGPLVLDLAFAFHPFYVECPGFEAGDPPRACRPAVITREQIEAFMGELEAQRNEEPR